MDDPRRISDTAPPPAASTKRASDSEALVDRARRHSEQGWAEIVRRSESRLRVLLRFRMDDRARMASSEDDLLQETWLEASRRIDAFDYRGPASLHRWLAGILRNKLLHARRSGERSRVSPATDREHESPVPREDSEASGLLEALRSELPGVSSAARSRDAVDRVRAIVAALPIELREVVLLRSFEGLSGREAAECLGVDESTVSVRFKKALATCADRLEELRP